MLYHLLYLSSARTTFKGQALAALLDDARRRNAAAGISGMLLHADGNFIQYIEGEADTIKSLFFKITRDNRHGGILTISEGMIEARVFPDWSMGYRSLTLDEQGVFGHFDLSRIELAERVGDAPALIKTMMSSFYESTHRFSAS